MPRPVQAVRRHRTEVVLAEHGGRDPGVVLREQHPALRAQHAHAHRVVARGIGDQPAVLVAPAEQRQPGMAARHDLATGALVEHAEHAPARDATHRAQGVGHFVDSRRAGVEGKHRVSGVAARGRRPGIVVIDVLRVAIVAFMVVAAHVVVILVFVVLVFVVLVVFVGRHRRRRRIDKRGPRHRSQRLAVVEVRVRESAEAEVP